MKRLAIKVDADTLKGYREGVPRLLSLFESRGIKASFFFSFGPDNTGKAVKRVLRPGYLHKVVRSKAVSRYGYKSMLYGTLVEAPMIVVSDPSILAGAISAGHDCGVRAWDGATLINDFATLTTDELRKRFERAAEVFARISGKMPRSFASPGWLVSSESLAAEEELGLDYASDTRGRSPFYPVLEGKKYGTLQIPTTMKTMDELTGLHGVTEKTLPGLWLESAGRELNVMTVRAEFEGISGIIYLNRFLSLAESEGYSTVTLAEIAAEAKDAPACGVDTKRIRGRASPVAVQAEQ